MGQIVDEVGGIPDPSRDRVQKAKNGMLLPNKFANSAKEAKTMAELDKKIDLSKPLLPQVKKLTREEFLLYVKRPRHLDDYEAYQLFESPWRDWFETVCNRNMHFNVFVLECIAGTWLYDIFWRDDKDAQQYSLEMKLFMFLSG